jgi:predicted N-acetyltransferase YhbS
MPTLTTYRHTDFPALLKWQAIAFMRVEWPFVFEGEGRFATETYPPELQPVHFVAAEGDSLISYAAVLRLSLVHAGKTYQVYGFGNMFTFPPYRREGYGRRVLQMATDYVRQSDVDLAILFCDPKLERYYAASGWQATRTPTCVGTPAHSHIHDVLRMMLFLTDKGQQGRSDFETLPLYVDTPW